MFSANVITFDQVASTNKTAAELLSLSKVDHGTVILAHEQTDGRGQRGRSWVAAPGLDVTLSIVVKPHGLRADAQFAIGKVAALAVHDTVRNYVANEVRIKWPNDVLVDRRKIAGILIKNDLVGELVMASIIGIGINVNNTSFDPELVATSIAMESGNTVDRMEVAQLLLDRFNHWWEKWDRNRGDGLVSYTDRLWTRGRWAEMTLDGEQITARAMDVDELGRLIVEHEDGQVQAYGLDRLRFVPR
ncbi:MAG: biotin--[acetyl-CoA-carboxylase] ligase [Flavobacteriales bacterium]|nr:biotin--[acetyl-CoA-carboxylase] ligase [Flavobacteriales bacterium]